MENMVKAAFPSPHFFQGKRILVTGHTGFKGAWLCEWLTHLGAQVSGYALPPETPSLSRICQPQFPQTLATILDADALKKHLMEHPPEMVIHMAAQALVRESYRDPVLTWKSNVGGTLELLAALDQVEGLKAVLVVTTDKCYKNTNQGTAFVESDALGGHDPYSASKAATEILCESWYKSFWQGQKGKPLLATARAGNVIGGGDFSKDRLIPDAMRAVYQNSPLEIRMPNATRPWQHVLDALRGYLLLAEKLLDGRPEYCGGWNFGPPAEQVLSVEQVLGICQKHIPHLAWSYTSDVQFEEARTLALNPQKSLDHLGWEVLWDAQQSVNTTVMWYKNHFEKNCNLTLEQIANYELMRGE